MAGIAGLEPTHDGVKVRCLTNLAISLFYGVNDGTRTHDNQNHNLALYQLNYIHHTFGAGSGNRTHLASLEGWSITDIRYPHIWSGRRGSNSRHPPWQGGALPTELLPQQNKIYMVQVKGVEPPRRKALDPKSSASASSATPAFSGDSSGTRTPDTMIKSHVLYHLS